MSTCFEDHQYIFTFLNDFSVHCNNFSPGIVNAANLATLDPFPQDISFASNLSELMQSELFRQDCLGNSSNHGLIAKENLLALT